MRSCISICDEWYQVWSRWMVDERQSVARYQCQA